MTMSNAQVTESLELFDIRPGLKVRMQVLRDLLPDTRTALFFGKAYKLDYVALSNLLRTLFHTTPIQALLAEGDYHSMDLQDYIVDVVPPAELQQAGINPGSFTSTEKPELLHELWDQLEVEVAASITELCDTLGSTLTDVVASQGKMLFSAMMEMNRQRAGVIGTYRAQIKHEKQAKNLLIFDVSGSVSEQTARQIVDEVVALAYKANATLAIVSNTCSYWEPGTYSATDIMAAAEFGGTHYEALSDLLCEDWATVITIADYDSSADARRYIGKRATGRIQQVLDISLVSQPTFLSECVGQLADKVTPMLVGNSSYVLGSRYHEYYG